MVSLLVISLPTEGAAMTDVIETSSSAANHRMTEDGGQVEGVG